MPALLDANLDIHLVELLRRFQMDCDTADNRGCKTLRNGELVAAASPIQPQPGKIVVWA